MVRVFTGSCWTLLSLNMTLVSAEWFAGWNSATDGNVTTVRVVLFAFKKAFEPQ